MAPSLEDLAYAKLQITDRNITDTELIASFYRLISNSPSSQSGYIDAFDVIATVRQSRTLLFIRTVVPSLTSNNVGLLTTLPLPPTPRNYTESYKSADEGSGRDEDIPDLSVSKVTDVGTTKAGISGQDENPSEEKPALRPGSSRSETIDVLPSSTPHLREDSDFSVDFSSVSSSDEYVSSSSESIIECGKQGCVCEDCGKVLADPSCSNEHPLHQCAEDLDITLPYCPSKSHDLWEEPCSICWGAEESTPEGEPEELSELFWDPSDGIWRCGLCFWEVEADNAEEGYCHCQADGQEDSETPRRIQLLEYAEFEPADSDSSVADSIDSEPDSGDESAIEDNGPFVPYTEHLLAGNYDPFEPIEETATQPMDLAEDT